MSLYRMVFVALAAVAVVCCTCIFGLAAVDVLLGAPLPYAMIGVLLALGLALGGLTLKGAALCRSAAALQDPELAAPAHSAPAPDVGTSVPDAQLQAPARDEANAPAPVRRKRAGIVVQSMLLLHTGRQPASEDSV